MTIARSLTPSSLRKSLSNEKTPGCLSQTTTTDIRSRTDCGRSSKMSDEREPAPKSADPRAPAASIASSDFQPATNQSPSTPYFWHSEADLPVRRQIAIAVHEFLLSREPGCSDDRFDEIGSIARRLEHTLYCEADSMEKYRDMSTLQKRLRRVAISRASPSGGNRVPRPRAASRAWGG